MPFINRAKAAPLQRRAAEDTDSSGGEDTNLSTRQTISGNDSDQYIGADAVAPRAAAKVGWSTPLSGLLLTAFVALLLQVVPTYANGGGGGGHGGGGGGHGGAVGHGGGGHGHGGIGHGAHGHGTHGHHHGGGGFFPHPIFVPPWGGGGYGDGYGGVPFWQRARAWLTCMCFRRNVL